MAWHLRICRLLPCRWTRLGCRLSTRRSLWVPTVLHSRSDTRECSPVTPERYDPFLSFKFFEGPNSSRLFQRVGVTFGSEVPLGREYPSERDAEWSDGPRDCPRVIGNQWTTPPRFPKWRPPESPDTPSRPRAGRVFILSRPSGDRARRTPVRTKSPGLPTEFRVSEVK